MARSKDPNREYDRNGRVKPLEGPTPETALKHQQRAASLHIPAHMETGYAETTFGVLYARGMISVEQYELCKKLRTLRDVLYGTGNARCSSVENASRGLPNDTETKSMRETWAAYKSTTDGMVRADRHLFEHVILRNNYREWMRLEGGALFSDDNVPSAEHGIIGQGDNHWRDGDGHHDVYAKKRELALILGVIRTLSERMPREVKDLRSGEKQPFTQMGEGMQNALYGDDSLLDKLYAAKAKREKQT